MADAAINPRTGLTNFRRYMWWSLTAATTGFLIVLVGDWILDSDVELWARVGGGAGLAVTAVASVTLFSRRLHRAPHDPPPLTWLIAGCAGAVVLAGVLLAVRNYGLWSFAPAIMASITATFLPARARRILIVCAIVIAAALGGLVAASSGDGVTFATLFPAAMVASFAWITLGFLWSWDVAERLNEARQLEAKLAVKEERLRFAADLHDIQGHHLQVIALKGELAARLAASDPGRAAAEMKEVQRLATDALQDTRAVVQGYRRTTLEDEITNATKVLAATNIDATMNTAAADGAHELLSDASRHLLGLVMREATTNVIRHSQARHAEISYDVTDGIATLRISNDGAVDPAAARDGTGLASLAERLNAAGGALTWTHEGETFSLIGSLPVVKP